MEWLLLGLISGLAWYIWDTLQAKELALAQVKRYAEKTGIQVLDEVVSRSKSRLQRTLFGQIKLAREFDFEFSSVGDVRYHGTVSLLGGKLVDISLEPYVLTSQEEDL